MIERRELLKWSAACLGALAAADRFPLAEWLRATEAGDGELLREASEAALGRACFEALGADASGRLTRRVQELFPLASTGLDDAGRVMFRELRQQDFDQGRTVNVDGWILAETEVGVWLIWNVAALERSNSCRTGITSTCASVARSRTTCSTSARARNRMRRMTMVRSVRHSVTYRSW